MWNNTYIGRERIIEAAINLLKTEGFNKIKANLEGFEKPVKLLSDRNVQYYYPDITACYDNAIFIFDIELTTKVKADKLKLFPDYVLENKGKFFILTPENITSAISVLLSQMNIEAEIVEIT